jgi:hypothetical protein
MTNPTSRTITLRVWELRQDDAPLAAGKDITPGMFCELTAGTIQPHSNASAIPAPVLIAIEAPWREGSGIDDAYDIDGEIVDYQFCLSGDQLYALLDAGEEVDSLNDRLGSNGDGTLKVATTYAFCRPLELVDNSAGYAAVRIRVEVL